MKLDIVWTTQFKKDYKLAIKRHRNIELLSFVFSPAAKPCLSGTATTR